MNDSWLMWSVLSNSGSSGSVESAIAENGNLHRLRIGVPEPYFFDALQPDVRSTVCGAIDRLSEAGATIVDAPWPDAAAARACAFLINRVETAAVHERVAVADPDRFARYGIGPAPARGRRARHLRHALFESDAGAGWIQGFHDPALREASNRHPADADTADNGDLSRAIGY